MSRSLFRINSPAASDRASYCKTQSTSEDALRLCALAYWRFLPPSCAAPLVRRLSREGAEMRRGSLPAEPRTSRDPMPCDLHIKQPAASARASAEPASSPPGSSLELSALSDFPNTSSTSRNRHSDQQILSSSPASLRKETPHVPLLVLPSTTRPPTCPASPASKTSCTC